MTSEQTQFVRTVILGNSGSGKSWLARRLADRVNASTIDLDEIHWLGSGFKVRQEPALAVQEVRRRAGDERWIIEGVYGWLAVPALERATALVWLDLPIGECLANVKARGQQRDGDDEAFAALLDWVAGYATRTNASSRLGHERAFNDFAGRKARLATREEMAQLLADIAA